MRRNFNILLSAETLAKFGYGHPHWPNLSFLQKYSLTRSNLTEADLLARAKSLKDMQTTVGAVGFGNAVRSRSQYSRVASFTVGKTRNAEIRCFGVLPRAVLRCLVFALWSIVFVIVCSRAVVFRGIGS